MAAYHKENESELLDWDGSDLGWYNTDLIVARWKVRSTEYFKLNALGGTVVICILRKLKNPIPIIIEEFKKLFGLVTRGHHLITIGSTRYVMYYVPVDSSGLAIDEVPISELGSKHELRTHPSFLDMVRRVILVSDILHFSTNYESDIRVRHTSDGFVPVSYFCGDTDLHRERSRPLSHKLITWLGENYDDIIKDTYNPKDFELSLILDGYREELNRIVERYGLEYQWIVPFIIDKLAYYFTLSDSVPTE
jgi:hypothetical protein